MSTSNKICKDGASIPNNDDVCVNMLHDMSTADNAEENVSICANCGKEGSDVTNTCNKCKQVKYCNAICKKVHKKKHKKQCDEHLRLAAERATELHDEKLFKQPPPAEDCPICFLRIPSLHPTGSTYYSCCGKVICRARQLKVLYYRHLYIGTEGGGGVDRIKPLPRELMHKKIPVSFECSPKGVFIHLKLMN